VEGTVTAGSTWVKRFVFLLSSIPIFSVGEESSLSASLLLIQENDTTMSQVLNADSGAHE
jgi:hypothetical protein